MSLWQRLNTTVGHKLVTAVTGLALFAFLMVHMAGNLQVFLGPSALNAYAHKLKSMPGLLWSARFGLLALLAVHLALTTRLYIRNRRLRSAGYAVRSYQTTTASSLLMIATGLLILSFVVFHLMHFTVGVVLPEAFHSVDDQGRHDVYTMVLLGFQNPAITAAYLLAMLVLASHLNHALFSVCQTLGLRTARRDRRLRIGAAMVSTLLVAGFLVVPIAIFVGWIAC